MAAVQLLPNVIPRDITDGHEKGVTEPAPPSHPKPDLSSLDLRREDHRRKTLERWPAAGFMQIDRAAASGLYYDGDGDKLRCHFCKVVLSKWKPGDDPREDHEKWSEHCPLLLRRPVGNVPAAGHDECGVLAAGPAHPAFITEAARLGSFRAWPARMRQTPEALADAGFYYTGVGDQTVCFSCGGGLKDWEDDDVPWEQHAQWFKRCDYLRVMKDPKFIRGVCDEPALREPVPAEPPFPASHAAPPQSDTSRPAVVNYTSLPEDDTKMCKICFAGERIICFLPCGHVVACPKCSTSVAVCPLCREPISKLQRLYFS